MADEMHRFINFLHEILSISYVFSVLFLFLTVSMRNCMQSKPNYTRSNGFRHAEPARGHSNRHIPMGIHAAFTKQLMDQRTVNIRTNC